MKKPKFKKKRILAFKQIIIIIMSIVVVLFIINYSLRLLINSDYFKIKELILSENNPEGRQRVELSYLIGQNIFTLDLDKESRYIQEQNLTYRKVRLAKVMPNRIFVDFIKRKEQALIKLYRYFALDYEAVLFDAPLQLEGGDLPIILGLETKISWPKVGKKYNIKELMLALDIIKELNLNRALKDYKIKTIDLSGEGYASVFIKSKTTMPKEILEVKLGQDNIKDKIAILAGLLIQVKNDINDKANMKYIDLRFKEPVIKLNEDR